MPDRIGFRSVGRAATVVAASFTCMTAAPARAQNVTPQLTYTFRASDSDGRSGKGDKPSTGTVHVRGDLVRIDVNSDKGDDPGSYILVLDRGTRMVVVHPAKHEADEMNADTFERIIGRSLHAVRAMVRFTVQNLKVSTERVGTGGTMLGHGTEHLRLNEQFDVAIRAMGFNGGTERTTVTTDYWVSPGLDLGSNPLLALLERATTAMAQSDPSFVQREDAARQQLLQGTPLRTVVQVTTTDDDGKVERSGWTSEVTSIRQESQPASLFEIPSGYSRKTGGSISF